jgi:hypothetical protein
MPAGRCRGARKETSSGFEWREGVWGMGLFIAFTSIYAGGPVNFP